MNERERQKQITDLVALVFRAGKGCQQYPFGSVDELEAWAARKPYCAETLRVMPVKDMKLLGDKRVPAAEAAKYVREALSATPSPTAEKPSGGGGKEAPEGNITHL